MLEPQLTQDKYFFSPEDFLESPVKNYGFLWIGDDHRHGYDFGQLASPVRELQRDDYILQFIDSANIGRLDDFVTSANTGEIQETSCNSSVKGDDTKFEDFLKEQVNIFCAKLRCAYTEEDYSNVESLYRDWLDINGAQTLVWTQGLIEQGDDMVYAAILSLLKRMEFEKVHQAAYFMAAAGLHHRSDIVKSASLSLIGRWHNITALKLLEDFEAPLPKWLLVKYQQIKNNLERYVLSKED